MLLRLKFLVYLMKIQILMSLRTSKEGNRFLYLNEQRPLWVLEDQVSSVERDISHITFTTTAKPHYPSYYFKYRSKKMIPNEGYFRRPTAAPPIQNGYSVFAAQNNYSRYSYNRPNRLNRPTRKQTFWRRQQPLSIPVTKAQDYVPSMPRFDSVPSDIDATDDVLSPIFIYNGPKGEIIMNTMLSTQKYPMQEPVPGEILYPPTVPIFRPKPIVQQFRVPGQSDPMNLTLIPFYAHEAIVPRFLFDYMKNSEESTEATETTLASTDLPTAVLYEASAATRSSSTTTTTTTTTTPKPTKKRRHKKAKHYSVYRSPDEVHWRPTEAALPRFSEVTTPYPMVLANPLHNHRYSDNTFDGTTTSKPPMNFKLTYKDEDSNFQIVYVDESLEKPIRREVMPTGLPTKGLKYATTSKPFPLKSSHYAMDKEYYAFPVYTLGKLLNPKTSEKSILYSSHFGKNKNQKKSSENSVDTWFIMNSKYKGHRTGDGSKKLSSKYVEVPPAAAKHSSTETSPETTLETSVFEK